MQPGRYSYGYRYGLGAFARLANGELDLATLFGVSDQGMIYDPNPLITGVSPGQEVGTMTDVSGKGNHATNATAGNRPRLWQSGAFYALDFETDDWLQTAAVNLSNSDKLTIVMGISKDSDAAAGIVVETSVNSPLNNGSFYVAAPEATGVNGNFTFFGRGTGAGGVTALSSGIILAPNSSVLTLEMDIAGDLRTIRRNGAQIASSSQDLGTGNLGNFVHYFGRRAGASLPFNGRLHYYFEINRKLTVDERAIVEARATTRTPL